jgi:hypothetical protein
MKKAWEERFFNKKMTTQTALDRAYSLNYLSRVLTLRGSKRIALQFPDESLRDSPSIVRALKTKLLSTPLPEGASQPHLFVLGDTTFGSCCVDEVAAEHTKCDLIIHFGHSCLSSVSITPTVFVFGRNELAGKQQVLGQVARALTHEVFLSMQIPALSLIPEQQQQQQQQQLELSPRVLLLWDPDCTFVIPRILNSIASGLKLVNSSKDREDKQEILSDEFLASDEERILSAVTFGCKLEINDDLVDDLNDEMKDTNEPFEFISPHSSIFVPTLRRTSDPNIPSSSPSSLSCTSICGFLIPSVLLSTFKTVVYLGSKPTRCRALIASFAGTADVIQVDPTRFNNLEENEEKKDSIITETVSRASDLPRGLLI